MNIKNNPKDWKRRFYQSAEWMRKKEIVLKRAGYQCQICRRYGRHIEATEVHHIAHLEDAPEKALEDSNLIALCKACHNKQHPEKIKSATEAHRGKRGSY